VTSTAYPMLQEPSPASGPGRSAVVGRGGCDSRAPGAPVVETEVGLADQAGRGPAGVLAGGLHGQGRAGVEDLVEAPVELEAPVVLDVDAPPRASGPRALPPTMHVNLSPRQFAEPT
jgi:hypothetical protein